MEVYKAADAARGADQEIRQERDRKAGERRAEEVQHRLLLRDGSAVSSQRFTESASTFFEVEEKRVALCLKFKHNCCA